MAHASARLTPKGRRLLVDRVRDGWTITRAAQATGISRQTGSKWVGRFVREGASGLVDRRSTVHRQARAHPVALVEAVCARRRELRAGPHVLGWETGVPRSTVYALLRRNGLGRLDRLEPRAPIVRYERERPGELVHLDTKMLGRIGPGGGHRIPGVKVNRHRGIGWNRVHIAIDDHSRLAYAEELTDESPATTAGFLERAWRFYASHGITVERILTDNGGCCRSRALAAACDELGIGHRFTRPYRPQTNGKAVRMVRTLLNERAAGAESDCLIGQVASWLAVADTPTAAATRALWSAIRRGRGWRGQLTTRRPNGKLAHAEATAAPVRDGAGSVVGVVAVIRDASSQRALDARVDVSRLERTALVAALGTMRSGDAPGTTGAAILLALLGFYPFRSVSIFGFEPDGGIVPLATLDRAGKPLVLAGTLPASRCAYLRERASKGPWIENWHPPPATLP